MIPVGEEKCRFISKRKIGPTCLSDGAYFTLAFLLSTANKKNRIT